MYSLPIRPTLCALGLLTNFQTFHGGRLGELAGAAVLFSAHREARATGVSARGLGREGGLGQASQQNKMTRCNLYLWCPS